MSHYDVLGIEPTATPDEIRAAYRELARRHHPDRASVGSPDAMHTINEAYRVLSEPARRAVYDSSLRSGHRASPPRAEPADVSPARPARLDPPRVPWRGLAVAGVLLVAGVFVLAQFSQEGEPPPPDGILRNGDCVEIEPDNDAREVACTGEQDLVVRAFVNFDGTCPTGTEPHRDRQGMGVACIERPR